MNRLLKKGLIVAAIITAASVAEAQEAVRTILGSDISGSSTFAYDQHSADAAGAFVQKYVAGLGPPHDLHMVSVGDAGLGRRVIDIKATVTKSRESSAKRLAAQFGGYFRSLPGMVSRGEIVPQGTTSLIAFFHSLEPLCATGDTAVIVFTDGVEWSASVDGEALVAGTVSLPKPERAFMKGCSVSVLGVGQVKSTLDAGTLEERLSPQWQQYLTEAGATPVTVGGGFF